MKLHKILLLCLLAVASIGSACAHGYYRGGARVGVYFGPTWGPAYYPQPYYYSPPPVVVLPAPQPQVYIEQSPPPVQLAPAEQQYWYYCVASKSYYPYVKECRDGWQKVLPRPEQ
jgi:hypothetical protein